MAALLKALGIDPNSDDAETLADAVEAGFDFSFLLPQFNLDN